MIPADHITIDGGRARLVVTDPTSLDEWNRPQTWRRDERPCDPCGGMFDIDIRKVVCPACDGTGRHTFEVKVECDCACHRLGSPKISGDCRCTLRVHVLDVLQVDDEWPLAEWQKLPPAAAPGMWAVELEVHQ